MRKPVYKGTKLWMPVLAAARSIGVSKQYIRELYKFGKIAFVFPYDSAMSSGISLMELSRLGKFPAKSEMYIGRQLKPLAVELDQNYYKSLEDLFDQHEIFTGTTYVSPSVVKNTSMKVFMFACAGIYNYNEVIKRSRPKEMLCHLILCDDGSGTARSIKKRLDRWYPGVTLISAKNQLFKVKQNCYEKFKTSNN